jgi:hypothetical protein
VQAPVVTHTGTAGISGSSETADIGTCSYVSAASISSVNVNVWSAPGSDDAIQGMAEVACTNKESISGLADLACWYDDQHVEIQLADRSYFLDIFATDDTDTTDALLTLSETAVSRLP